MVAVFGGYLVADAQLTIPPDAFAESAIRALSTTDASHDGDQRPSLAWQSRRSVVTTVWPSIVLYGGAATNNPRDDHPFVLCLLIDVVVTVPLYYERGGHFFEKSARPCWAEAYGWNSISKIMAGSAACGAESCREEFDGGACRRTDCSGIGAGSCKLGQGWSGFRTRCLGPY